MASLNQVTLIGNIGNAPELKSTTGGTKVCNLSVATNDVFKDKTGQKVERCDWHRVTVFGDQAENCAKYLSKGRAVAVTGRLQYRETEKDGVKRYYTDIIADRVVFLGSKADGPAQSGPEEV